MSHQSKAKRRKGYDLRSLKIEANSVNRINVPSPTQDERRFAGVFYDNTHASKTKTKKRTKKKLSHSPSQVNAYLHLPKLATVIAKNELGRSQQQYRHSVHLPIAEKDREKHKNASGEETADHESSRTRVKSASSLNNNTQGKLNDRVILPRIPPSNTVQNTEKTPSPRSKAGDACMPRGNDVHDPSNFRKKFEYIRDTEDRIIKRKEEQCKPAECNDESKQHHLCSVCKTKKPSLNESTKSVFAQPATQRFPEGISIMRNQRRLSIYLPMVNFEENDLL